MSTYNDSASTVTTTSGQLVPPGAYGLEDTSKNLDSTNKTISVSVNHFTVFVVVDSTSSVLTGKIVDVSGGSGGDSGGGSSTPTATITPMDNSQPLALQNIIVGSTVSITGLRVSGAGTPTEDHSVNVISSGTGNSGAVTVIVRSKAQTKVIALNGTEMFDVNDPRDGSNDISIKVTGISAAGRVSLLVTSLVSGGRALTVDDLVDYTGTEIEAVNFPNPFDARVQGGGFKGTKTQGQLTLTRTGATTFRMLCRKISWAPCGSRSKARSGSW